MWQLLIAAIPIVGSFPFMIQMLKNAHDRIMSPTLALTAGVSSSGSAQEDRQASEENAIEEYNSSQKRSYEDLLEELAKAINENGDFHIYGYLKSLLEKLNTLYDKLVDEDAIHQIQMVYAKYNPILRKIVDVTSPKYYGDFVRNPEHWEHPKEMREQVEKAVKAVVEEVAEDIRKVNSSRGVNFQVSIESLVGSSMELPATVSNLMGNILEEAKSANNSRTDLMNNMMLTAQAEIQKTREEYKAQLLANEIEENQAKIKSNEAILKNAMQETSEVVTSGIRGGSREEIARFEDTKDGGQERFTKTVNSIAYTLVKTESKDPKRRFIASSLDTITSGYKSQHFTNEFDAAMWVDKRILENQKQHPYRNHCKYCEDVKVDSPAKSE